MDIHVVKFGGSSLNRASAIRQACDIIRQRDRGLVVVVSAMGGMTDNLLKLVGDAVKGDLTQLSDQINEYKWRYHEAAQELLEPGALRDDFERTLNDSCAELESMARSLAMLRELTPKIEARVLARGERMMAFLVTALLHQQSMAVTYVDAPDIIHVTHGSMGWVLDEERCQKRVQEVLLPQLRARRIPVVPGFIAKGPDGELVTLGRGGSDYSATILAASIGAKDVTLYKEVDGFMTADPKYVPTAQRVSHLHYREAAELSYYGAKILHPRSIIPLIMHKIPLNIKNTFDPTGPGTRIDGDVVHDKCPVRALTAIIDQSLIAVEGSGMMGVPGVAERTFKAMSSAQISVSTISQASSEASICFTVPSVDVAEAVAALRAEFHFELAHRLIDRVRSLEQVAIIAVVGIGMRGLQGVAARTFSALARRDVNIIAIAQGSSELNISVVISAHDVKRALTGLHEEYRLDKHHALAVRHRGQADVVLAGFGQIGQALCRQIIAQKGYFQERLRISPKVVAIADSSGLISSEHGFESDKLNSFIALKQAGHKLQSNGELNWSEAFTRVVKPMPLERGVLVDVTALQTVDLLKEVLAEKFHVVLANKKPLTSSYESYLELIELSHRHKCQLRYEATVGAGLPILDTLMKFKDAGDEVLSVAGCMSGTLGYLMTAVEDGLPLSVAVKQASEKGYTEPDPREDLSGMDVARKALILARTIGIRAELDDVAVEPLLMEDAEFDDRLQAAHRDGKRLRYVARVKWGEPITVGLEAVGAESPFYNLRGVANQISMTTRRYSSSPLTVTGPGAGAEVTAAGVLNDIVAIALAEGEA